MFSGLERFRELYEHLGVKYEILKDILWLEYNRMIVPQGPVKFDYSISRDEARYLLSRFPRAFLVRCTNGFTESAQECSWYAVVCDEFYELDEISAKNRSEIRRGLKNCTVSRVDADYIAEYGYDVFMRAFQRYRNAKKPGISAGEFRQRILAMKDFSDIIHFWGVFHDRKLIAYAQNYIYDNIEVNYSTVKFDPDFLRLYPSYALFYLMNKFYLEEKSFEYANDGFRNILHGTNIQQYLIDKFKFRKVYTGLKLFYRPYLSIYLSITFPLRSCLGKLHPKLRAIYMLEEMRRSDCRIKQV